MEGGGGGGGGVMGGEACVAWSSILISLLSLVGVIWKPTFRTFEVNV